MRLPRIPIALSGLQFCLALVLAPWQQPLLAQETRGSIIGKVTDTTGGVIPGASVEITNKAMGTKVALVTNDGGLYKAPYLLPGTYSISVEMAGFKKYVRDGIVLEIGSTLEQNVVLEVGSGDQMITVTSETPILDTASGSKGQIIDSRRVSDLPLVHGEPYTLIALSAGVAFARDPKLDRPFEPTHIVGYAMDGTRPNRSDLTIDGATSTATANANEVTASYVPPTDIIQEFKVQTATYDSQFGNTEGGVTTISIKSGTNQLHGTGYFWGEPGNLAANDFFANRNRQPRPDSFSYRYGGSIGGPVYLPKLYDGRNRTFFLWGYEGIQDARPRNNGTPTVPTAAMKNGDFSALLRLGSSYQIYNPFTRRAVTAGRFEADPFPNNIIPSNLINPVAKALLQYFPDPITPGSADGTNNFQQPGLQEKADYYNHTIRIDHILSPKQRIFVRGSWYQRDSTYNNYFGNLATGTLLQFISRQGAIDDVYAFNATTVLNVRYGYNRLIRVDSYNPESKGFDLTSVGFPAAYNNTIPASYRTFPRIDLTGYQGTGFNTEPRPIDTHSFGATLNKTVGSHLLKFGGEYRIYRENSTITINDVTGRFVFDSAFTRGPLDNSATSPGSLGQSVAALLLGLPSGASYVRRPASYAEESSTWGFFVHDDWKLSRRLTLNLGLRYELETALVERYNRSVRGFDYGYVQPIEAQVQANYARNPTPEIDPSQFRVRGGLTFAGVSGQPEGLYETPTTSFMPRFGLAFQLNDKTVVRGGYGIFFGFLGQRRGDALQSGFSRDTNMVPTIDGVNFIATLSNPFPGGILEPRGAADGPTTFLGQAITFFNSNPAAPYNQRWDIGFQRELPGGWVTDLYYVGNRGTKIEITRNINVTPQRYLSRGPVRDPALLSYLTANVPNPFFGVLPVNTTIGTSSTIARERLLRPFPQFDTVTTTTSDGYSWYHAMQASIQKRFSSGFTLQTSYTFSKFMQATELLNQDDPRPTEMISDIDYPHRFAGSGIYELPFGPGKLFSAGGDGFASRLIGGWQIQGIYAYQSGAPISFDNVYYNGNVKDIGLPSDQQTLERWFNTAGFVTAAAAQPDHNVRTFPLRFSSARYPTQNNWDLSIVKNTTVTENTRIQFRVEFMNAFNRVWFANPNGTNGLVRVPTSATFGQLTNTSTQANYPRRLQWGLKLLF